MLEDDRAVEIHLRRGLSPLSWKRSTKTPRSSPTPPTWAFWRAKRPGCSRPDPRGRRRLGPADHPGDLRRPAAGNPYNVPARSRTAEALTPHDGSRRDLLGQASFLLAHSHPTSSSATKRKLVRVRTVPGHSPARRHRHLHSRADAIATSGPRIQTHLEDPPRRHHSLADPIGLAFEGFDRRHGPVAWHRGSALVGPQAA